MRIVGGDLALDFLNTRSGPPTGQPDDDILRGYPDLVAWARQVALLDEQAAAALDRSARADPAGAQAAYEQALRVRDHLDHLFQAIARGGRPAPRHLTSLRDHAAAALAHGELRPHADGFRWDWPDHHDLRRPLWPVAHAAAALLTTGPLDRVKGCAGCRFLFVDESKNRSRRWCAMRDCGTTAKIRRYVARRATARTRPRDIDDSA